jgi:hypothetical protein
MYVSDENISEKENYFLKYFSLYSQTCVQRPPMGPENVAVMQRAI